MGETRGIEGEREIEENRAGVLGMRKMKVWGS